VLEAFSKNASQAPTISGLMIKHGCIRKTLSEFLQHLEKTLSDNLALNVLKFSPTDVTQDASQCQIFFVDYLLDESGVEQSLIVAERLGRKIKDLQAQPLVILMSDKPNVNEVAWTAFRDKADLIGGTFHFFPKGLFAKEALFLFRLADIVQTIEDAHRIQRFVRQIDDKVQDVVNRFRQTVKGLTLQDYGFIEKLSLQGEGQPLGDYLVWLFGAYFGQMAVDATADGKDDLDRMHFKRIPDVGGGPSPGFVALYEAVVSERVPGLATPQAGMAPELHLGDIFVNEDSKKVLMVITPECDLVFTEEGFGTRKYDEDRTVLLIPGECTSHELGQSKTDTVSDYVLLREKRFKIAWEADKLRTLALKDVSSSLLEQKYERVTRLKPPFILAVQGNTLRQLSRVGKPVGPLPFVDTEAAIWVVEDGTPIKKSTRTVRTYMDREESKYVLLPVALTEELLEIAAAFEVALETAIQTAGGQPKPKHGAWLGDLRALRANLELCLSLRGPHKLPKKGAARSLDAKPFWISSGWGDLKDRTLDGPIYLDIRVE